MRVLLLLLLLLSLAVGADEDEPAAPAPPSPSAKANKFFEEAFTERLKLMPMEATRLGLKQGMDRWDDLSEAGDKARLALVRAQLLRFRQLVHRDSLDPATQLSYDLWAQQAEEEIEDYRWRNHGYLVNQMHGWQDEIPAFLVNNHRITSLSDAQAYVARLRGVRPLMAQLITELKDREKMGVMPPKFVFARALESCSKQLQGAPFTDGKPSVVWADFQEKVKNLTLPSEVRRGLLQEGQRALLDSYGPAYKDLMACLEEQQARATEDDGVWKLPDGAEFYKNAVRRVTTTEMTPDQIHQLGLAEVERIQKEMQGIMKSVGFQGTLPEFFAHLRDGEQYYYPNTDEGKAQYLRDTEAVVNTMRTRLPELFQTLPKAKLTVKRVEAFREKTAGKAFYESPAPDGSRPGIYYVNLYNTKDVPKYQMEALAYHEAIPGHHMQLSIAQELTELPRFRRFGGGATAYVEGWGLYCEQLPKEIGLYADPYSNFGRLSMELFRSCRLVVDTGLHAKKWTRQQAIDYYVKNTPNSVEDCTRMVERHVVMPGQATAYKVGMNRILELRDKAKKALGDKFDLRQFHEVVLSNGALPLSVLEGQVDAWIKKSR